LHPDGQFRILAEVVWKPTALQASMSRQCLRQPTFSQQIILDEPFARREQTIRRRKPATDNPEVVAAPTQFGEHVAALRLLCLDEPAEVAHFAD
jgi:hypothetical protein